MVHFFKRYKRVSYSLLSVALAVGLILIIEYSRDRYWISQYEDCNNDAGIDCAEVQAKVISRGLHTVAPLALERAIKVVHDYKEWGIEENDDPRFPYVLVAFGGAVGKIPNSKFMAYKVSPVFTIQGLRLSCPERMKTYLSPLLEADSELKRAIAAVALFKDPKDIKKYVSDDRFVK